MLKLSELREIREHLENSQNPLFFFDNDVDGLCAYAILQRAIGRGRGVAIKSFPDLDEGYIKKVEELNPDYIFILDKPSVSKEFIDRAMEKNLPIVWIDHHNMEIDTEILEKVSYYNSYPSAEPTTYLAQQVFERKEDLWISMVGCIGDAYLPGFGEDFEKEHPELYNSNLDALDTQNMTEIGKMATMLNFGLKDTTTNVVNLMKLMTIVKDPYELLDESSKTRILHKRYAELKTIFNKILEKAREKISEKDRVAIVEYGGEMSMSSEISNRLLFENKDKLIVVMYKRPDSATVSIRGKGARDVTLKAIEGIDGATGGGHEVSCGAKIPLDFVEEFKTRIKDLAEQKL